MTLETAKATIQPGQIVQFKPAWEGRRMQDIAYKKGKVVKMYENHFLVRLRWVYECFTYTDVMLGEVKVVDNR